MEGAHSALGRDPSQCGPPFSLLDGLLEPGAPNEDLIDGETPAITGEATLCASDRTHDWLHPMAIREALFVGRELTSNRLCTCRAYAAQESLSDRATEHL